MDMPDGLHKANMHVRPIGKNIVRVHENTKKEASKRGCNIIAHHNILQMSDLRCAHVHKATRVSFCAHVQKGTMAHPKSL